VLDNEDELKKQFAFALLRMPHKAFEAAVSIFGADSGRAFRASTEWVRDPVVIDEMDRLIETHGIEFFLINREGVLRRMTEIMDDPRTDKKDAIAAGKIIAEVLGIVSKPGVNVEVNNNVATRVMLVRDNGTDDDWEKKLVAQQHKLMDDGSGSSPDA
jgi:hypothetical protein